MTLTSQPTNLFYLGENNYVASRDSLHSQSSTHEKKFPLLANAALLLAAEVYCWQPIISSELIAKIYRPRDSMSIAKRAG